MKARLFGAALAAVAGGLVAAALPAAAQAPFPAPPAEPATTPGRAVAVLAGGCFWGMEGVFEHVKGVVSATAGYAGGTAATATYDEVSSESTNHAEAVRVVYDPAQVSYGQLLEVYFAVAHDPTQKDGQFPDSGRSYRSAIFAQTPAQRATAAAYIAALNRAHAFPAPIATRLESGAFYPAEAYHQGYLRAHPDQPYIATYDLPKIAALHRRFPALYRN